MDQSAYKGGGVALLTVISLTKSFLLNVTPVEIQIITVYSETFKGHIRVPINSRIFCPL